MTQSGLEAGEGEVKAAAGEVIIVLRQGLGVDMMTRNSTQNGN